MDVEGASENKEKLDTTGQGGRVELRSDSEPSGKIGAKRWWWIGGVVVLVVLLLGGVITLVLTGRTVVTDEDNDGGFFADLPLSDDRSRLAGESGLSGRQCDDANRRSIAVMLAADPINRPVSGFAEADMVFELPVLVSDVTRLLAVYQCGRPEDIGSVRSARHDYLFLSAGVDAIIGHWGGSYHALNRISAGEFDTINALTNPFGAYYRKNHLPAPYNGFTTYENLWNALQKLDYRTETKFEGYQFKDDIDDVERVIGGTLSVAWPGSYRVHYEYDTQTNRYQRYWAGIEQIDGDTKEPVAPSVVIIMRATNEFADGPGGYNDVGIEGSGEIEVYQDGTVILGRWEKDELRKDDPVNFMDQNGESIKFTRGQLWVMAVEPGVTVTWEEAVFDETAAEDFDEAQSKEDLPADENLEIEFTQPATPVR